MGYKCKKKLANDLGRRYNISVAVYEALIKGTEGKCMLCGDDSELLNIDHCHTSGKLRGCLCRSCNLGLSNFKDDPELLHKAAEYLEDN